MTLDRASIGWAGVPLVLLGLTLVVASFLWLAAAAARDRSRAPDNDSARSTPLAKTWRFALIIVLVVGTFVRIIGIGDRGLSHPEAYTPMLDLPAGMSMPPPRHGFVETAVWHFRTEPHPPGYYLAMWAWTSVSGATLTSIRVPAMVLGVLSIWLIYRVGTIAVSPPVGVVAAALLALHGFHTFWSQAARMYVPGGFLGLLSTWLLLRMTRDTRTRPWEEAAYVITTVAGAATVEFFWPLLCGQILWVALRHTDRATTVPRAAVFQSAAFMMAAPMLSHAAMLGRDGATPEPTLTFLRDFLTFGFVFQNGAFEARVANAYALPLTATLGVFALSLALLAAGVRAWPARPVAVQAVPPLTPLAAIAAGASVVMMGLAIVTYVRHGLLAVLSVVPVVALVVPLVAGRIRPAVARVAPPVDRWLSTTAMTTGLVPLLALAPALAMFAVSYLVTLTAGRAFLMFVPYLVILIANGVVSLASTRVRAVALGLALAAIFTGSNVILHRTPISPRDYQGIAQRMAARMEPGDLVFVPALHWAYTPLLFYVEHRRLVADDYAEALKRAPAARVWLPIFAGQPTNPAAVDALASYLVADQVSAVQAEAQLFVPPPAPR